MKKIIFLISMVVVVSFFNACSAGYVAEEPVYHDYHRPDRPSNDYIWVDGGWNWNRRTNTYIQLNGNWVKQDKGRRQQKPGYWKKTPHGSKWVRGSRR
jgi:hypothetical protein